MEVELLRGEFKRQANNPTRSDGTVHEYCPPEHVASSRFTDEVFQFNYRDTHAEAEKRFEGWLERALVIGLEHWRHSA